MKKLLAILLVCACLKPLLAGDIETRILFGNIGFPWSTTQPVPTGQNFPHTNWNYGAMVRYSEQISDIFSFEAQYLTDTVLRHQFKGLVSYQAGILTLKAGPLLGLFNSLEVPVKGGMAVGVGLKLPGIFFAEVLSEASLGAGLYGPGDYIQEAGRIAAGFYVMNAICTASIHTRRFYLAESATDRLVDSSVYYNFNIDLFKKGVSYRLLIDLGYEDLSRQYADASVDRLGNLLLGAQLYLNLSPGLSLSLGGRASLFSLGLDELALRGPDPGTVLFQSFVSLILRPGQLSPRVEAELP